MKNEFVNEFKNESVNWSDRKMPTISIWNCFERFSPLRKHVGKTPGETLHSQRLPTWIQSHEELCDPESYTLL